MADEDEQPRKARNVKEMELLKTLLQPVTWDLAEDAPRPRSNSAKGKARAGTGERADLAGDLLASTSLSTSASSSRVSPASSCSSAFSLSISRLNLWQRI